MPEPRPIQQNGKLYALVIPCGIPVEGVRFLTSPDSPFQVGIMEHSSGHSIRQHQHPSQVFPVQSMSEFLSVERGAVKATIYDEEWHILGEEILRRGDALLLLAGGHAFEVLEPCRLVEVKQGPFPGNEQSKVYREEESEGGISSVSKKLKS